MLKQIFFSLFFICFCIPALSQIAPIQWAQVLKQIEDSIEVNALPEARSLAIRFLPEAKRNAHDSTVAILHFAVAVGDYVDDVNRGLLHLDTAINL